MLPTSGPAPAAGFYPLPRVQAIASNPRYIASAAGRRHRISRQERPRALRSFKNSVQNINLLVFVPELWRQEYPGSVDDNLARVLEIYGDPVTDHRLHLAETPVGLPGMAHQVARFEEFVHRAAFKLRVARMSTQDLSALVSARLCHDLISPMGAIGNGLELLQMSAGAASPELDLISDSVSTALAKLRFYRIAFGPADPEARLTAEDASDITSAMYVGRFSVAWGPATRSSLPRDVARVVFLAILCLEKSLPMGGLVRVSTAEDAVSLNVEGRRTAAPGDLWAHVTEGQDIVEMRPDCVQFPLLRQALADTCSRLSADFTEDSAALRLSVRSPLPA